MTLQDILPITSIALIVVGAFIILGGIIWLANVITNEKSSHQTDNTEHIIEELNQMFSYFTDQIHQKDNPMNPIVNENKSPLNLHKLNSNYYNDVVKYTKQGKTPEEIAKELNIGKGEVNLILGIAQMR